MKTVKTIFALMIILFAAQYTKAQTGLMSPVSFKLKNGTSVIIAENQVAEKVYTKFTTEDQEGNHSYTKGTTEILNAMLNKTVAPATQVNFDNEGGHINASSADFNNALTALSTAIQTADLNKILFEKAKAGLIAQTKLKGHNAGTASVADLEATSLKDVREFYHKNMIPSKTFITIAGNIKSSTAKAMVQKAFGSWTEATSTKELSK
ncbi:insulinase family protein [Pedobacter sp. PAMC26386]|nr:insulinase family protein [Pedobacter sp. PAMC26386]